MEFIQPALDWWNEYYPIIVGFGTVILGVVSSVAYVYLKLIKPLVDKFSSLKQTVEEKANTISPLEKLKASSMMTDLKSKLANPTIDDSLKLEYQQQLFELEKLVGSANNVLDQASEKTNTYL